MRDSTIAAKTFTDTDLIALSARVAGVMEMWDKARLKIVAVTQVYQPERQLYITTVFIKSDLGAKL